MNDTLSTKEPPTTPGGEQVGSTCLFAWRVFADDAEAMCIAFAATRNEARAMGKGSDWLCEFEWTEIKAKREPRADKWAGEKAELLDGSGRKSAEVMHALGWSCIDEPSCEWCGAGQWDLVPESRVEEREDHDWQAICDGCYAHSRNQATREAALPSAACSLTWCDGCLNRRPCITIESGITYEGKDCPIHLCRWCRGHRSRRINAANR